MVKTIFTKAFDQSLGDSLTVVSFIVSLVVKSMEENLSQTKKARAARKWRKQTSLRKRFEKTLKEFLKVKYNGIYDEYVEFYEDLDKRYPNIRELHKTPGFKRWARAIFREQQASESEGNQSDSSPQVQADLPTTSCQDQVVANCNDQQDVLSVAFNDVLADVIPAQEEVRLSDALSEALSNIIPPQEDFDNIEEIINQLQQDVTVQAILDPFVDEILNERNEFDDIIHQQNNDDEADDEGIELNLADEIDVEPFDYELEVF